MYVNFETYMVYNINKASSMETGDVNSLLDEAEELITLAFKIIYRIEINLRNVRKAA